MLRNRYPMRDNWMKTSILKYIAIKCILLEFTNPKYFIIIIFLNPENNSMKLNNLPEEAQVISGISCIGTPVNGIPKPVPLSHMQCR